MKRILLSLLLAASGGGARANDGVFYASGNQLVPLQETDIAVRKEVLTITLGDDGLATVEVDYELENPGKEKRVLMGFEAPSPSGNTARFDSTGRHPFIQDFTVEMNGQSLPYAHAVCFSPIRHALEPVDFEQWKLEEHYGDHIQNQKTEEYREYAYVYHFQATFLPGLNRVRHTYRYRLSKDVATAFCLPYKLTPALRWANGQIDEFTLRIRVPQTAKHFVIDDDIFQAASFHITEGTGKTRHNRTADEQKSVQEVSLRNGTLEWKTRNFAPKDELYITSADHLFSGTYPLGDFYDRSRAFPTGMMEHQLTKSSRRILRNLPYAHRGYVFRNKNLQKFFEGQWWYMPDPDWQPSTDDFTLKEQEYIQGKLTYTQFED